ncbi:tRNA 2-thiouridine(34) synthase MnmA [Anaerotruncus sp. AF02-27]|uniref:tRNA 2-thiouridine(34) synthase MnmA n=1 Tax=Anaerotruncus sp. AF02-27 TaxID=2292191 RepID=UPI0021045645|nr:tRNA 2-thiouridine(34) synthase MnmA [Anaerotruncus sp. AF02-27]
MRVSACCVLLVREGIMKKKKVLVAMSGGVDSSVAALLLQRQGYEVGGATFELFDGCNEDNAGDAKRVCEKLGIPHYLFNYREIFAKRVLDYFVETYAAGATPNPCIACNRNIKFGKFLEDADRLGYEYISTGHYASVRFDAQSGLYQLWRSAQERKDQSYVLYHLTQAQLSRLILPIESYTKDEVRAIAAAAGLPVASKSDSQDICFVPDGDYVSFIERYTGNACVPGDYLDETGKVIGRHKGVLHYTIGQRKGLGVSFGRHRFVSRLDPKFNTVTLSDESAVFSDTLLAGDLRMIAPDGAGAPFAAQAKIRYAHKPAPAEVYPLEDGRVQVRFEAPQRAATKGQAVVFYDGNRVLGGATIV